MNCPNCHQPVEPGAAFCGNCGQALSSQPSLPNPLVPPVASVQPAAPISQVPSYALSNQNEHTGETKALLSLIFGIIALPASLVPIAGLVLGIVGVVLGTMTRHSSRRRLSTIGIIVSSIAIVVALAIWAITFSNQQKTANKNKVSGNNTAAVTTASVKTPCYNVTFSRPLNTDYDQKNTCDMRAYEGATITSSNDVYKVYGNQVSSVTATNFANVAKSALEKDVSSTLPGFIIDSERTASFAGSPAYIVNASNHQNNIAVVEAAVLHKTAPGYNVFSLVHATKGSTTDLKSLESQWQWK